MGGENGALAIIPNECFRWRPRVQFIESFRTREAALDFAFEHGHNLIVERNEGGSPLFDVLQDPDGACTEGLDLELLKTEEVLVDPDAEGWTSLMLLSFWHLVRRVAAAVGGLYVREVAPRLRNASRRRWVDVQRTFRYAWNKHVYWGARNLRRQFDVAASFYRSEITPRYRHAASRYWWSSSAIGFRRWLHRHSHATVSDLAKRFAAEVSGLYAQEIVPSLRHAASQVRQADIEGVLRRGWSSSLSTCSHLSRQIASAVAGLYRREITPRLRHAAGQFRQADVEGAFRRGLSSSLSTCSHLSRQFAAAVAGLYRREIAPRLRHAASRVRQADIEGAFRRARSSSLSTASGLAKRVAAAVAVLYKQQVAPFIRQAASSFRRAEIEGALHCSVEAVAAQRHSNTSQLG